MTLFTMDGLMFLFRWIHLLAGVTWIGVLYYFNFIQGSFFAETDSATKANCTQKLLPRALWWFRWGAMFTFGSGLLIILMKGHQAGFSVYATSWGVAILTGATLGTVMWANVWFVIWPAQKLVIQSAKQVAEGGQPMAEAAAVAPKAALTSRTNTLFSFPMLFFMGAASHLPFEVGGGTNLGLIALVFGLIIAAIELNALKGKMGPMTTVKGVIHSGIVLTVIFYVLLEILA